LISESVHRHRHTIVVVPSCRLFGGYS
jgi:hypothetical protein